MQSGTKLTNHRASMLVFFFLTPLAITPMWNIDPINLPKFALLCTFAGLFLHLIIFQIYLHSRIFLQIAGISGLCILWMGWVVYSSELSTLEQLYGAFGRNTGFLTYFSLIVIFLATIVLSNMDFARKILTVLSITGFINAVFGLLQWRNYDAAIWNLDKSVIAGTFGNENFLSSFLAIATGATFVLLLLSRSKKIKVLLTFQISLQISVIYLTKSSQGIYLIVIMLTLYYFFFLFMIKKSAREKLALGSGPVALLVLTLLGIIGKGPMGGILFQESTSIRGDYWRAGFRMTVDNAITGLGMDTYGYHYRNYRDSVSASRDGALTSYSNSAHNIVLDLSSSGGVPLALFFLVFCSFTFFCGVKILIRKDKKITVSFGLIVCWIMWLFQSMISVNNIGLAIVGFVLSGIIIGFYLQNRTAEPVQRQLKLTPRLYKFSKGLIVASILSMLLVGISPLIYDYRLRSSLEQSRSEELVNLAQSEQANSDSLNLITYFFIQTGDEVTAETVSLLAIDRNPRNLGAWRNLLELNSQDEEEYDAIRREIKHLDPYSPL